MFDNGRPLEIKIPVSYLLNGEKPCNGRSDPDPFGNRFLSSHSTSGFFLPFVRMLCVAYGLNNSISVCSCFSRILVQDQPSHLLPQSVPYDICFFYDCLISASITERASRDIFITSLTSSSVMDRYFASSSIFGSLPSSFDKKSGSIIQTICLDRHRLSNTVRTSLYCDRI